jgi:hypothetical protein
VSTVALIVLVLALYFASCLIWPYTRCGRCSSGKHHSPTGTAWRNCRACGGSGRKVRLGRRLFAGADDL